MKRRGSPHSRQRGMSLIELLVSVLIFSIGLLGLVALQSRASQISMEAEDVNRASLIANQIITQAQLTRVLPPDGAIDDERLADQAQGGLPNGAGLIENETPTISKITITWRGVNAKSEHRYVTHVVLP